MIKIFKLDSMDYTPFTIDSHLKFLRENGIVISNDEADCDVFVTQFYRNLKDLQLKYGSNKKYLVWTPEPRYDTHFENKIKDFLSMPPVHIMNIYTKDIYLSNQSYWNTSLEQILDYLNETNFSTFKHKRTVVLALCRNNRQKWSLKREGKELDLSYLRTQIALEGYNLNKVDIYGSEWPDSIAIIEESKEKRWDSGWVQRKYEILSRYHFNLCFENTNTDYYCSEKIWDSIRCRCLPIYYGKNNKIYEDFPQKSFLDYCNFPNSTALFEYIEEMSIEEFRSRMNLCIEVDNKFYRQKKRQKAVEKMLLNTVQKIKEIAL